MTQVFIVRSNNGRVFFTTWESASAYLLAQVEEHGIATIWTKLMAEKALAELPRVDV